MENMTYLGLPPKVNLKIKDQVVPQQTLHVNMSIVTIFTYLRQEIYQLGLASSRVGMTWNGSLMAANMAMRNNKTLQLTRSITKMS